MDLERGKRAKNQAKQRGLEIPVRIEPEELVQLKRRAGKLPLSTWVRMRLGLPPLKRGRPAKP